MENIGDHYINKAILVKFLLHMHKIYLTSTSSQKSDARFNLVHSIFLLKEELLAHFFENEGHFY